MSLFLFVYETLDANAVLLKVLKRHKLNPSDAKCSREGERKRKRARETGGGREREKLPALKFRR